MKKLIFISFLIVIIFFFLGIFYTNAQGNINITQPISGSHVPQLNNTIKVTASAGIPVGQCVVIFVQDPNRNWWPYMNVNPNAARTIWEVNGVQYGMPVDRDRTFNLQAVTMNNNVNIQGLGIPTNSDGSISLNNYAGFIKGLNSSNYSAIISVIRN